jgi:hypothetical protein
LVDAEQLAGVGQDRRVVGEVPYPLVGHHVRTARRWPQSRQSNASQSLLQLAGDQDQVRRASGPNRASLLGIKGALRRRGGRSWNFAPAMRGRRPRGRTIHASGTEVKVVANRRESRSMQTSGHAA